MKLLAYICIVLVFVKIQALVDGPAISFVGQIICPRALQTRCNNKSFGEAFLGRRKNFE